MLDESEDRQTYIHIIWRGQIIEGSAKIMELISTAMSVQRKVDVSLRERKGKIMCSDCGKYIE